jgi:hypothetical protein
MPRICDDDSKQTLYDVTIAVCDACVKGEGGVCTSIGCEFYKRHAPAIDLSGAAAVKEQ